MANPTILFSDTASETVDLFEAYLVPNILLDLGRHLNWDAKARVFLSAVLSLLSVRGGEVECYAMTFGKWLYPTLGDDSARQKVQRDLRVLRDHQSASQVNLVEMRAGVARRTPGTEMIRTPPTVYAYGQFPALFERVQSACLRRGLFEMRPSQRRGVMFGRIVGESAKASGLVPIPDHVHGEWAAAKRDAKKKKGDILPGPLGLVMSAKKRQEIRHTDRAGAFGLWLDGLNDHLGQLLGIPDTIDDMTKFRKLTEQVIESSFKHIEGEIRIKNRLGK